MGKKEKTRVTQYICEIIIFVVVVYALYTITWQYMCLLAERDRTFGEALSVILMGMLIMYFASFVQTIIHELGHLLFGLISGYRFSRLRIRSYVWIKSDGKLQFRKMEIPTAGAKCLMSPPDLVDGKMPHVLYNLGGVLCNFITGAGFFVLYLFVRSMPHISIFPLMFSVIAFTQILLNGVPMRLETLDNDGYNAMFLGKSKDALRAFWVQMKIDEQMAKGVRIKDMPAEWFALPSKEGMQNSMTAVLGVFAANRLLDEKRFEEADELMQELLASDNAIAGFYRNMMTCDRIYCELIGECRQEQLQKLRTKEVKKFMRSRRDFLSVVRTEYAYALLLEQDIEGVQAAIMKFETIVSAYPYAGDIQGEQELLKIANERFAAQCTE